MYQQGQDSTTPATEQEALLLSMYQDLNETGQKCAFQYVEMLFSLLKYRKGFINFNAYLKREGGAQ